MATLPRAWGPPASPSPIKKPALKKPHVAVSPGGHTNVTPHPNGLPTAHKGAGAGPTDPNTGLPKMPSMAEIRAKSNADAWKSIQQMQSALPTDQDIAARYGAMRGQVQPLVDAHRDWLEKAGEYQVNTSNALSGMVQTAAGAADTGMAGSAAAAGAGAGYLPSTNVSPTAAAMPVAAYGTSTANYLHSLVPYASAIGGEALGKMDQAQREDTQSMQQSRQSILDKLPDLQASNFKDSYGLAVDQYKSELAALVSGQKGDLASAKFSETKSYHDATLALRRDSQASSDERAASVIALNKARLKKLTDTGTGARTAGDVSNLKSALANADKMFKNTGGTKGPTKFTVTLKLPGHKDPLTGQTTSPQTHPITAATEAEVRKQMNTFMQNHPGVTQGPQAGTGKWQITGAIKGVPGFTGVVGKKGEYNRRQDAWNFLLTQNKNMLHPVPTSDLKAMWRQMEGLQQ